MLSITFSGGQTVQSGISLGTELNFREIHQLKAVNGETAKRLST